MGFQHRRHLEVLTTTGAQIDRVSLSGGGSRSPHWPQMIADILGLPVTMGTAEETGALGAAIGAAVGFGRHPTEEAAVAAMTRPRAELFPRPFAPRPA